MTDKEPREIAEIFENAMHEFKLAMQHRQNFSAISRKRITHVIWFSSIAVFLLAAAMFYLIFNLTKDTYNITVHVVKISDYMHEINQTLTSLAGDIQDVRQFIGDINKYMSVVPTMNKSVGKISENIIKINPGSS